MDTKKNIKYQKTVINTLTELSAAANLKIALASPQTNQRVSKQIKGGKVDSMQPPHVSGFFVPVNLSGDNTSLPRGYGIKKRLRVNTCGGVPLSHLETRGSFKTVSAKTLNNTKDLPAMNANTHGTATPVATKQGASSNLSNECLLHPSVLSDALQKAKTDAAKGGKFGKANAYADLLKAFHTAIFPAFISETDGNICAMARLLGLSRSSITTYTANVGLSHQVGRKSQGGAA